MSLINGGDKSYNKLYITNSITGNNGVFQKIEVNTGSFSSLLFSASITGNDGAFQKVTANTGSFNSLLFSTSITGNDGTFQKVTANTGSFNNLSISKGTVTQTNNLSTAVTINSVSGVITTVNATLSSQSSATFIVNNTNVLSTSSVIANIIDYSGSNGIPYIFINSITNGSFTITIINNNSGAFPPALNGILKIYFVVIQ